MTGNNYRFKSNLNLCILSEESKMFNELTKILDGFLSDGIPGYDCIVLHKGNVIYRHMNGYSDKQAEIPVSGN